MLEYSASGDEIQRAARTLEDIAKAESEGSIEYENGVLMQPGREYVPVDEIRDSPEEAAEKLARNYDETNGDLAFLQTPIPGTNSNLSFCFGTSMREDIDFGIEFELQHDPVEGISGYVPVISDIEGPAGVWDNPQKPMSFYVQGEHPTYDAIEQMTTGAEAIEAVDRKFAEIQEEMNNILSSSTSSDEFVEGVASRVDF